METIIGGVAEISSEFFAWRNLLRQDQNYWRISKKSCRKVYF